MIIAFERFAKGRPVLKLLQIMTFVVLVFTCEFAWLINDVCSQELTLASGINLVKIEPGTFLYGNRMSPKEVAQRYPSLRGRTDLVEDLNQVLVEISQSYYISKAEITRLQFRFATGVDVTDEDDYLDGWLADIIGDSFPVTPITWYDAIYFCNKLSLLEDLTPYYSIKDSKRKGSHIVSAVVFIPDLKGDGFRLPTEQEWENAARGGKDFDFWFGDDPTLLWKYENVFDLKAKLHFGRPYDDFADNADGDDGFIDAAPVMSKLPNPFGLYDMLGNVTEWCDDGTGPTPNGVLRGGTCITSAWRNRCCSRTLDVRIGELDFYTGFRVARFLKDEPTQLECMNTPEDGIGSN